MNVVSLFDGISCGQLALQRAEIQIDNYYASEIDKNAIKVTQHHFPGTIQLGSVLQVNEDMIGLVDLIIAGSPCQGFSFAGNQLNFNDPRSKLFFEYIRILNALKKINPKVKFLLENVKMSAESENVITKALGVRPIRFNSDYITAQSRQRLYWTNIPVNTLPKRKNTTLKDILTDDYITDRTKSYCIDANYGKGSNPRSYAMGRRQIVFKTEKDLLYYVFNGKETKSTDVDFRILTPEECEILQTLPPGYTNILAKSNRYHAIGNGWTVDFITHLFNHL